MHGDSIAKDILIYVPPKFRKSLVWLIRCTAHMRAPFVRRGRLYHAELARIVPPAVHPPMCGGIPLVRQQEEPLLSCSLAYGGVRVPRPQHCACRENLFRARAALVCQPVCDARDRARCPDEDRVVVRVKVLPQYLGWEVSSCRVE